MKKYFLFLLLLVIFSFAGCNTDNESTNMANSTDKHTYDDCSASVPAQYPPDIIITETPEPITEPAVTTIPIFINPEGTTLETRILPPEGFNRVEQEDGSLGAFVRNFSMKPDGAKVHHYDGTEKYNQSVHVAVFDLSLENRDLQQCADSVMRMYGEYYWHTEQYEKIAFHFTNGFLAEYTKWRDGYRIVVEGNDVSWTKSKVYDDSYQCFLSYMQIVFSYAGTLSMESETVPIDMNDMQIGDVFLSGGSPGHVVMVVDVCENEAGEKAFLLAQGYMPAQDFHVLKNPENEYNPWYYAEDLTYPFRTPQYTFYEGSLKRYKMSE